VASRGQAAVEVGAVGAEAGASGSEEEGGVVVEEEAWVVFSRWAGEEISFELVSYVRWVRACMVVLLRGWPFIRTSLLLPPSRSTAHTVR
jgi:hypothetical protein